MTFKEQTTLLMTAIQSLMQLYQEISKRSEPLTIVWDSELKKIPQIRTAIC